MWKLINLQRKLNKMNQLMDIDKVTEFNLLIKEIEKFQATKKKFAL